MSKTIAEKLQIKPGTTLWVSHPDHAELIGKLPSGVDTVALEDADAAVLFADDAGSLRASLEDNAGHLDAPAVFWVAYPKSSRSDVDRDSLWPILREHDMRPIGQVSIDDVWSALRFRPLNPGEEFNP